MRPAGFWRRYAAYSIDALAVTVLASPLLLPRLRRGWDELERGMAGLQARMLELFDAAIATDDSLALPDPLAMARDWAGDPQLQAGIAALASTLLVTLLAAAGLLLVAGALWFVGFEASRLQATPGKRLLGLRVTGTDFAKAPAWRIGLRFAAGIPSWLLLHLGHALAGWNRDRRAFHDFVAGTRVVLAEDAPATLPRWAVSWLLLQGAAFFALLAFVMYRYAEAAALVAG
ncbi:RDD family protein [Arenimonas composti]|uniref:RDD domain-containing protein n=1 Tax=Arenimonas composti TR7-09 = DSM 18010 TaxID=1121013 RepID=A0A091BFG1_9GAMM|nr:RDD family protein [Arenimonas composti]KFN49544.1 hypothetical protein P873_10345 [Arenimonas composti TR7-09 = DSM 18010]